MNLGTETFSLKRPADHFHIHIFPVFYSGEVAPEKVSLISYLTPLGQGVSTQRDEQGEG